MRKKSEIHRFWSWARSNSLFLPFSCGIAKKMMKCGSCIASIRIAAQTHHKTVWSNEVRKKHTASDFEMHAKSNQFFWLFVTMKSKHQRVWHIVKRERSIFFGCFPCDFQLRTLSYWYSMIIHWGKWSISWPSSFICHPYRFECFTSWVCPSSFLLQTEAISGPKVPEPN